MFVVLCHEYYHVTVMPKAYLSRAEAALAISKALAERLHVSIEDVPRRLSIHGHRFICESAQAMYVIHEVALSDN